MINKELWNEHPKSEVKDLSNNIETRIHHQVLRETFGMFIIHEIRLQTFFCLKQGFMVLPQQKNLLKSHMHVNGMLCYLNLSIDLLSSTEIAIHNPKHFPII